MRCITWSVVTYRPIEITTLPVIGIEDPAVTVAEATVVPGNSQVKI